MLCNVHEMQKCFHNVSPRYEKMTKKVHELAKTAELLSPISQGFVFVVQLNNELLSWLS
jgi:hypothetical protein